LCIGGSAQRPWSADRDRHSIFILEFVLEFNVAEETTLEDVRDEIVDLLRVTSYIRALGGEIVFYIPAGPGGADTQHRYRLGSLRTDALIHTLTNASYS
jgi:hypothetical protein